MNVAAESLLLDFDAQIAQRHTALLVVDMQNDFCAAAGYIDRIVKGDLTACRMVVQPITDLLSAARSAAVPVFWLRANYDRDLIPEPMLANLLRQGIAEVCCAPGSWGADWYGVAPQPGEPVIEKHCYSGFRGTDLHQRLQQRGIRTLVFSGVQTHVCVESTLRDAHSLGYYCVVPEDCVGSHARAAHQATLATIQALFGDVCAATSIVNAWASA